MRLLHCSHPDSSITIAYHRRRTLRDCSCTSSHLRENHNHWSSKAQTMSVQQGVPGTEKNINIWEGKTMPIKNNLDLSYNHKTLQNIYLYHNKWHILIPFSGWFIGFNKGFLCSNFMWHLWNGLSVSQNRNDAVCIMYNCCVWIPCQGPCLFCAQPRQKISFVCTSFHWGFKAFVKVDFGPFWTQH